MLVLVLGLLLVSSITSVDVNLKLYKVTSPSATAVCNDGTEVAFYYRRGSNNTRWVIHLQGGGYCYDEVSCGLRWKNSRGLMSSTGYPATRAIGGILSPFPEHNPHWHDSTMVFMPYCTSDSFSGGAHNSSLNWAFLGSYHLPDVVDELKAKFDFMDAREIVFTGSSAGAEGLLANANRMDEIKPAGSKVWVFSDSGWFLDFKPYHQGDCKQLGTCTEQGGLMRGFKYWQPRAIAACLQARKETEHWQCMLSRYAYPYITPPSYWMQFRFDAAQMGHDGIYSKPTGSAEIKYVQEAAANLTMTFNEDHVTHLMSPGCYHHTITLDDRWVKLTVNGVTLPDAFRSWQLGHGHGQLIDKCDLPDCNPTCPL